MKNNQSIEFQSISEQSNIANEIVRTSFRVPVEYTKNAFLVIDQNKYNLIDVSSSGFGIGLEDYSEFSVDDIIDNCELHIFEQQFNNLKIKIVHCSSEPESGTSLQCGIQWIDIDRESYDQLNKIVLEKKNQLLK